VIKRPLLAACHYPLSLWLTSLARRLIKSVLQLYTALLQLFLDHVLITATNFSHVKRRELLHIIRESPHKSCQLEPLPYTLLTTSFDCMLPASLAICNKSIRDGQLPECEKLAVIAPMLKKSGRDPDAAVSYRPISNLTLLLKLIEQVVCCQLKTYLRDHQFLVPQQSAYRKHHSTETATLKVASDIFNAADTGRVTILVLLDLSAAFDTVDHEILVRQLETTYGISGAVLRWMSSFLSGQSQVVHFPGQQSAQLPLICRVPQGSVLGLILFTLYTADVVRIAASFGVNIHCYADDLPYNMCPECLRNGCK
jgi:hypothetical protein